MKENLSPQMISRQKEDNADLEEGRMTLLIKSDNLPIFTCCQPDKQLQVVPAQDTC